MDEKKNKDEKKIPKRIKNLIIFVVVCTIIIILVYIICFLSFHKEVEISRDSSEWGGFGSYIGGLLGTILGGVSIFFVYITYNSQREIAMRAEFETHLFKMLDTQHDIMEACQCEKDSMKYEGNLYFEKKANDLYMTLFNDLGYDIEDIPNKKSQYEKKIREAYLDLMLKDNVQLNHYFGYLKNILRYIDEFDKDKDKNIINFSLDKKQTYVDFVQSQLSNNELYICVYYCVVNENDDLAKLMRQYLFFKNLQCNETDPMRLYLEEVYFKGDKNIKSISQKYDIYKKILYMNLLNGDKVSINKRTKSGWIVTNDGDVLLVFEDKKHPIIINKDMVKSDLKTSLKYKNIGKLSLTSDIKGYDFDFNICFNKACDILGCENNKVEECIIEDDEDVDI